MFRSRIRLASQDSIAVSSLVAPAHTYVVAHQRNDRLSRGRAWKNRCMPVLAETVNELRGNRTHGGSWMARRAVEALLDVVAEPASSTTEFLERLVVAGRELAEARPAMGAIAHAVGRLVAAAQTASHLGVDDLRRLVTEEANGLIAARDRAAASIAVHLGPSLGAALVLTHSAS